jgi:hypothetical protein
MAAGVVKSFDNSAIDKVKETDTVRFEMPIIRISQQTWDRLKAHATPLEDTPNDIVSMALDALDAAKRGPAVVATVSSSKPPAKKEKPASRRKNRFSQKELRILLLETLYGLGGNASTGEVQASLKRVLTPMLTDNDYEVVSNGNPRWWNAVCTVRSDLTVEGLLRGDSERGIWELNKQGREFLSARADYVTQLKRKGWGSVHPRASSFQNRSRRKTAPRS